MAKIKITEKNREILRKIVKEVIRVLRELDEATTTGNVAGFNTPAAFSGPGDEEKKKDRLVDDEYEIVDEAIEIMENRWLDLKKDETRTNNRKIADQTSKIRKELADIRKRLNWCAKIRNENEISKDEFHRRTERNLDKMGPILDDIRKMAKEFKI